MASKAAKTVLDKPLKMAERLLWEKYNKPNRNLFQALSAFEGYGVGRKVVSPPLRCVRANSDVCQGAVKVGKEGIHRLLLYCHLHDTKGNLFCGQFGEVAEVGAVYEQGTTWQGKGRVDMAGKSHAGRT